MAHPSWHDFFKLLSDETRLRILVLLAQDELCVCQLCGILELSQPKVSKHLARLRDRGLVRDRREDKFIYYTLSPHNSFQRQILHDLIEHRSDHPLLCQDTARLSHKEDYKSSLLGPVNQ